MAKGAIAHQVERLQRVEIWVRWGVGLTLWATVGSLCLWQLREDIPIWREVFTWAAVRSSLQQNRWAFLGLGLCVGVTLSTLIRQSLFILFGVSRSEKRALLMRVRRIRRRGARHPLWRWVVAKP
ncbi:MAG TPA: hypothetical protein DCQ32_09620 [Cyanobacteria bacterium UBA8156]|jgi:hypothetical protein|nr:hypothetical protein [Cyanobacteria bacterium UBA8156]